MPTGLPGVMVLDHTHHAVVGTDAPLVIGTVPTGPHHGPAMMAAVALRVLRLLTRPAVIPVSLAPRRTSWVSPRALVDQLLLPRGHGHRGPPVLAVATG